MRPILVQCQKKVWASKLLLMICFVVPLIVGCAGTKHVVVSNGNEGVTLGNKEYLFPDEKGNLVAGKLDNKGGELPPGAVIKLPKTKKDMVDTLKRWGVNVKLGPTFIDEDVNDPRVKLDSEKGSIQPAGK